jgi:uncharacterized membrane protein
MGISDFILIIPKRIYLPSEEIPFYWHIIGISSLIFIVFGVGYLMNHYVGEKIRKISQPLIKKTPILSTLFRISKQAGDTLNKKTSFKKVVLIEFPTKGVYSIAFIMGENIEFFNNALGSDTVVVFSPTTPNPTNGFLILVARSSVIEINMSVSDAIEYIISMGTIIPKNDLVSYL